MAIKGERAMIGKSVRRASPGVIIKDPKLLASLRLSPEARAEIERMERPRPWTPPIVLD
jgi:hypothetical protein